jgi:hypothetical protein
MSVTPLDFLPEEPEQKSKLTEFRVVWISALVALVIGCIPAVGTALVVSANLQDQVQQRDLIRCEGLVASVDNLNADIKSLQHDVKILKAGIKRSRNPDGSLLKIPGVDPKLIAQGVSDAHSSVAAKDENIAAKKRLIVAQRQQEKDIGCKLK